MRLMRGLIRWAGVLVASGALLFAASSAAKPVKKNPAEREAEAFIESVSSLLQPVATVADNVDWVASTDVTPEHTAERAGGDKVFAALVGSKVIIEKTKGFLKNEKQLDEGTARQLHKLLLAAAENPGTIPEIVGKRVEAEARLSSVLDGYTFCLQPKVGGGGGCLKPITANGIDDLLLKSRSLRTAEGVDGVEGDRQAAQAGPRRARGAAQPGRARDGLQVVLRAQGRRLRHERRRDDDPPRRHARDDEAALRRPAL